MHGEKLKKLYLFLATLPLFLYTNCAKFDANSFQARSISSVKESTEVSVEEPKVAEPVVPEPVKPDPEPVKPDPEPVKPDPEPVKPEPVKPDPEPVKPDPEPVVPEPVKPDPEPVKPDPEQVDPDPGAEEPIASTPGCSDGPVNNARSTTSVSSRYGNIPHATTDALDQHYENSHKDSGGMPKLFSNMGRGNHFSNSDLFVVSDYLHFFAMMYYLTGKQSYFEKGTRLIDHMFNNTDKAQQARGIYNPSDLDARPGNEPIWTGTFAVLQNRNVAHPGWRHEDHFATNSFRHLYNATNDETLSTVEVLTDGQVVSSMMVFVDLALNRNRLNAGERNKLKAYVPKVKEIVDAWQSTWRENISGEKSKSLNKNILITGSYFKIDPGSSNNFWRPVGFNQSANMLAAAMLVHKHTDGGVPKYLSMADKFRRYLLGPELRYLDSEKLYPYWPYSTDKSSVSDLDHTTFDMEFLLVANNNCYAGVTDSMLEGALRTVRDYAFKARNTFSEPLFADQMDGTGGYLRQQGDHVVMGTNWPLMPNANERSPVRNQSFNDQIAELFQWHNTNRRGPLYSSKYYRSAAEFILATENK